MKGRVLIIAGSDSGGGAGIQADIKAVTMMGGYAATAVTAITAQNTQGVFGVLEIPVDFIEKQIRLVLDDIGADVIKTGMLHNRDVVEAVALCLGDYPEIPVVVDPVMVATSGSSLMSDDALFIHSLKKKMVARAALVTPNIPEAEALVGRKIENTDDMVRAANMLLTLGAEAVLLKGGHGGVAIVSDVFVDADGACEIFESVRIDTDDTHGTGCTLASAIAACMAKGFGLRESIKIARNYVYQAIRTAPGFGGGKGPINHVGKVHEDAVVATLEL